MRPFGSKSAEQRSKNESKYSHPTASIISIEASLS